MPRPSLAYVSPFPPVKSGISAYSAALVRGLAAHFDVTLVTDDYDLADPALTRDFGVLRRGRDPIDLARFDHRLYNIGNQPFYHGFMYDWALRWPGAVILHDLVLYYLFVGQHRGHPDFYARAYALEGARGVDLLKRQVKAGRDLLTFDRPETLVFNGELLAASTRVLVHSWASYHQLAADPALRPKLAKIALVDPPPPSAATAIARDTLFARFGIPAGCRVITSFGFIGGTKLNREICQAVQAVNALHGPQLCYVMVGEGPYVDHYLSQHIRKTGYVTDDEFASFIAHTDLVVNLRGASMGEASAAVLRVLGLGKPCVVTDDAWFAELPEAVATRIDPANVLDALISLLTDWLHGRRSWPARVDAAVEYVAREHSVNTVAAAVAGVLGAPAKGTAREGEAPGFVDTEPRRAQ
jgi:hypothetical protein